MKRRGRYRRRHAETPLKLTVFFIAFFCILGYTTYYFQTVVKPIINQLAEMKATSMIVAFINDTMHNEFRQESDINNLLIIKTNKAGDIELVQANTPAMNCLTAELVKELRKKYKNAEPEIAMVPLGTLLGSQILSETGPYIHFKVMPLTVSKTDFKTEFVSEGINQTKYKVYLILRCKMQVLAPFSADVIEVEKTVLIAEAVILGKVPNSYVVVPEDKILEGRNLRD